LQSLDRDTHLAALAERIGAGDRAAESELIQHFARGARAVIRRHCRPGEPQVEDIFQDVMGTLLARLRVGAILDIRALPHYLRTMIRNACTGFYRQHGRRLVVVAEAERERVGDDPVAAAFRQQVRAMVHELLAELPVLRDRQLLSMVYIEGHPVDHVCAELGIARDHYHRVVHRARQRMRDAMLRRGVGAHG
jgi:RNA polymerase sigma-70 factor (ECF subfamily)